MSIVEQQLGQNMRGATTVASLKDVTKSFGQVQALRRVNFDIRSGELVALLGPNGAGKTTAVKLLLGLAKPSSGTVRVFGSDPTQSAARARTGAMLQVSRVPETLRVKEHVDLFSSYYPSPLSMDQTLAIAGLEDLKNREFGELSGGQKQRVLFALAVCGDPDLLFLDEPTVGMDVEARRLLWQQIRKLVARGKTVLLTTHYLEEADALADRVVVIDRGEIIAQGTPHEIKAKASGKRIRCRSQLPIEILSTIPGVIAIDEDRNQFDIRVTDAEPVLRELLLRDPNISGIEVTSAGLEEAFLALTSEKERI
jgi:ABC-2 type transport system ATP-binding protein